MTTVADRKAALINRITRAKAIQAELTALNAPEGKQAFCAKKAPPAPVIPSINRVGDNVVPVGCYVDNATRTMLTAGPGLRKLSFAECEQQAKDINARFFSMQAGFACFITNNPDTFSGLGASSACDAIQDGRNLGGGWANYVYQRQ